MSLKEVRGQNGDSQSGGKEMIRYLHIENIKSVRNLSMAFGGMNLLVGMNGTGKSTVIQTLLMLRQSYFREKDLGHLLLSGGLTAQGTPDDILPVRTENDRIAIHLIEENSDFDLCYACSPGNRDDVRMNRINGKGGKENYDCSLFHAGFAYLSADRKGYPEMNNAVDTLVDSTVNRIGDRGEYTCSILAGCGSNPVKNRKITAGNTAGDSLINQVNYWMGRIMKGIRVHAEKELSFSFENGSQSRIGNVGAGISSALPAVTALLTAEPGSIVIIENPESNLHPRGQAVLAELMARVCESGVQIICESHSDHIINGIRVAVRKGILEADKTAVDCFTVNEAGETVVEEILMDRNGSLSSFPEGLLDEWGLLLEELI